MIWLSNDLFAVKKHYSDRRLNKVNVPFAVVDLAASQYSYIAMPNSYSYGLSLVAGKIQLTQHTTDEFFAGYHGREYSLKQLHWYSLDSLEAFDDNYADSAA